MARTRYVYTNDILFHAQEEAPNVFHEELYRLLAIPFEAGVHARMDNISTWRNESDVKFSRKEFFAKSGISNAANSYYLYDLSRIREDSWKYFSSVFPKDTVFIGCELGLDLRERLTEMGYTYVNFWFHPYKLLDDIFFLVGSNSREIFKNIESYRISKARLCFYSSYYSILAERKGFLSNLPIEDGCCLFAGQTYADKSVQREGRFLNITDFADRIKELSRQYSKIYYIPHPAATANPEVEGFIAANPSIELLTDIPTYYMLASPKVRKVVALSSSVLYEAETFGKETEYLYKALFKIDEPFSLNSFVSVYQSYFAPSFWRAILGGEGGMGAADDILLDADSGKYRDMMGCGWGFRHLGRLERMDEILEKVIRRAAEADGKLEVLSSRQTELVSRQTELVSRQTEHVSRQDELAARVEGLRQQYATLANSIGEIGARVQDTWAWMDRVRNSRLYLLLNRIRRTAKAIV